MKIGRSTGAAVWAAVLVAALLATASTAASGIDVAHAARPTLTQLKTDIATAVKQAKAPNLYTTIPPLPALTWQDTTLAKMNFACYPQSGWTFPSNAAKSCVWGDATSKRTMFVFGDSESAMWLVALNPVAKALRWRIVFVAHTTCAPWPGQSETNFSGRSNADCIAWDQSDLALEKILRPSVVMPIGALGAAGASTYPTSAQVKAQVTTLIRDVSPARVVQLSPIPQYEPAVVKYSPSMCLVAVKDIRTCEYSPAVLVDPPLVTGQQAAARAMKEPFVNVTPLFCTIKLCALVVKGGGAERLVYYDNWHANRFYMYWASSAFQQLLKPQLPK